MLKLTDFHRQIETSIISHFMEFVEAADRDKNGKIDFEEWELMGKSCWHCGWVVTNSSE